MNVEIIGKRIRDLRRARNITQKDLASQLFMDSRTYSKIERGERKNIDVMTLLEIAKILSTDIMELLAVNSDMDDTTDPENIHNEKKGAKPILNKLDTLSREISSLKEEIFQIRESITHQNDSPK